MDEILKGGVENAKEILEVLKERETYSEELGQAIADGKRLEKEIAHEEKNLNSDMEDTLKFKTKAVTASEDDKISQTKSVLKDVESERNKAKSKGIRNRIENETKELRTVNKDLHRNIRRTLKENGLPTYCDTAWFYTLYCTQGGLEWLIKILVFMTGLIIIPDTLVTIIDPWWLFRIVLWIFFAIIFIAIYMTIYLLSKDKDNGTLEAMRELRDKISDNNQEIKKIKRNIKEDRDESIYNLGDFDARIADLNETLQQLSDAREEKLKSFEENEKQSIIDEINEKHNAIIDAKKKEIDEKLTKCNELSGKQEELNQKISNEYEKYLTEEYTNIDKIQKIIQILESGKAENIEQAIEILKNPVE